MPLRARKLFSYAVVITIKQHLKIFMKRLVAFNMRNKNKGFKEPSGMGKVPFSGADKSSRLQAAIFGA